MQRASRGAFNCKTTANSIQIRSATRKLSLRDDISYLIVGGLKGLCGSLAVYLAQHGAKHLVIMSRSGSDDEKSRGVLRDIYALGTQCDLVKGDVACMEDVESMFEQSTKPVGGIVQGAMVLRVSNALFLASSSSVLTSAGQNLLLDDRLRVS